MTHLLVAGLASVGVFLIWFALARTVVERVMVRRVLACFPPGYTLLETSDLSTTITREYVER